MNHMFHHVAKHSGITMILVFFAIHMTLVSILWHALIHEGSPPRYCNICLVLSIIGYISVGYCSNPRFYVVLET